ncbi:hypothetical protein SprV_0100362900 [Sparganum proliferum]
MGLRRYCLKDLLPANLLGETFLGFTANGRFIVSYSIRDVQFFVRFWAFPSHPSAIRLQHPFAQFSFKTYADCPFQSDLPAVRFLQSLSDPDNFIFLVASALDGDVLVIWGSLPQFECASCCEVAMSLEFSQNWSSVADSPTFSCPQHMRLLRLYPDHQSFSFSSLSKHRNNFSEDAFESADLPVVYGENLPFPPCLTPSASTTTCKCFRLSTVVLIHPSVCPKSGRLRLAWISQGRQVRVLSCSFSAFNEMTLRCHLPACSFPLGSCISSLASSHCLSYAPLAFRAPLLTSNYCSACYSWPSEPTCSRHVQTSSYLFSKVSSSTRTVSTEGCAFRKAVRRVSSDEPWPDGHRPAILSKSRLIRDHQCSNLVESEQSPANLQRIRNIWTPALLSSRASLTTCSPVSYLAMLQDIRASYIHWALVPIDSGESALANTANTGQSERGQSLTRPEALLANQLCGQCHSYFDVSDWQEAPVDEGGCWHPTSNHPLLAHMEEVVFDLCDEDGDDDPPERFLFVSPLEPEWLLVYDMLPGKSAQPVSRLDDWSCPSRHTGQRNPVALIDLATGRQHDPEEPCYRTRVAALTATCPSQHADPEDMASAGAATTLYELNNSLAVVHGRSLTHFTDPQGGYSIHL